MPQVVIRFNQKFGHAPEDDFQTWVDFEDDVARVVAAALNVEGSESFQLHPDDVEVFIEPIQERRSYFHRNSAPITIVVTANTCPERRENLARRNAQIRDEILMRTPSFRRAFRGIAEMSIGSSPTISVWTQLVDGAYATR